MRYRDREQAGQLLADRVAELRLDRPVVYALPRGGVPAAREVSARLKAPLDLLLVRKIGVPWQPELAAAAVVDGERPIIVRNEKIIAGTDLSDEAISAAARRECAEIERRRALYLGKRPPVLAEGRDVVIVDDGVATGASLKAAIQAVNRRGPKSVTVAVPVGAPDTLREIETMVDRLICLYAPPRLTSIGAYYDDFHQLTDDEVIELLTPS